MYFGSGDKTDYFLKNSRTDIYPNEIHINVYINRYVCIFIITNCLNIEICKHTIKD